MFRILAVLVVCSLCVLNGGCSEKKEPVVKDPNWRDTTDPSNLQVPDQMKKMKPGSGR